MAEGGALLRRYMGLNPYRGFESLSLRHFPMSHRIRLISAVTAIAALLFTQLALSAFACPADAPGAERAGSASTMSDCEGMGRAPTPLCQSHCQQGQQGLEKPAVPTVPAAVQIGFIAWLPQEQAAFGAPAGMWEAERLRPSDVPISIRNLNLRI